MSHNFREYGSAVSSIQDIHPNNAFAKILFLQFETWNPILMCH